MKARVTTFPFLVLVVVLLSFQKPALALLSYEDLAVKHMPVIQLSSKGLSGVDLTGNKCSFYDYKPMNIRTMSSNSNNLPLLTDGVTSIDLTSAMFDTLGLQENKYIDITGMYSPDDNYEEVYCQLEDSNTSLYYQVFYDNNNAYPYAIQYWFFYYFNDWLKDHPGDWETITLFLDDQQNPQEVVYSTHYEANRHPWNEVIQNSETQTRPFVRVSNGGHGSYVNSGTTYYLGTPDNHLGDEDIIVDLLMHDLGPVQNIESSWLNFEGRWGDAETAPHGPKGRTDASDEPSGVPLKSYWDAAKNKPYNDNCTKRFSTPIYQETGPWDWADGYRTYGTEDTVCLQQPQLFSVTYAPLTLRWQEILGTNDSSMESYELIIRSKNGFTSTHIALMAGSSDFNCIGGICSAAMDEDFFQEDEHYWFIRAKELNPNVVYSPWSKMGTFTLGDCPFGVLGDVNQDGAVSLADVILSLTTTTANSHSILYQCADVNGDSKIGVHEAIFALKFSGISIPPAESTGLLNDTGITWGRNSPSGNNTTCIGVDITAQDCSNGRDQSDNSDADGHAGFNFTKLDSNGLPLFDQNVEYATMPWSCVKDNVTGLIWEVKTNDQGLHHREDRYHWYNSDPATNGGFSGYEDDTIDGSCFGYDAEDSEKYCNTQAYAARVNEAGLCGAADWRLPTKSELVSLISYDRHSPAIDTDYFPNVSTAASNYYWSKTPLAYMTHRAWVVKFRDGNVFDNFDTGNGANVRLVRDGL